MDELLMKRSDDLSVDELLHLARKLAYAKARRVRDTLSIVIYAALSIASAKSLLTFLPSVWTIFYIFLSMLFADFMSGLVHWTFDTWGSIDTPVFKDIFITLREHHIDPTAITRRDFIFTWGGTCHFNLPLLALVTCMVWFGDAEHKIMWYNVYLFLIAVIHFTTITNQFHKWAHTHSGNPGWVKWLQKYHLVLPISQHHTHHIGPHNTNYCSVTGWANYPLEFINFWRKLEWIIEETTGYKPHVEEEKWAEKKTTFYSAKEQHYY